MKPCCQKKARQKAWQRISMWLAILLLLAASLLKMGSI